MKKINFTLFLLLVISYNSFGQISFEACPAFFNNPSNGSAQTYNFVSTPAQDVGARRTFVTSPHLTCAGTGGACPLRIIWTGSQWEIQVDASGSGTFPAGMGVVFAVYTNPSASTPNPPDLSLGTWVQNLAITGGACPSPPSIFSGDVQNSLSGGGTPTPVKLTSFTGQLKNQAISLTWQTSLELNNSHFDLERSADGVNFETIGRIEGNGTTTATQNYNLVDAMPLLGYNYYRLNQVDYDGTSEYSSIIAVNYEVKDEVLQVFPSPARDVLQVVTNPDSDLTQSYIIVDVTGIVLKKGVLQNS